MDDSFFGKPWHDIDEWRDTPIRHRYVHGGFEGTNARFSFYFPPPEQWQGRFVQPDIGGMGGNENIAQSPMAELLGSIPFAVSVGAYLVESNQGHLGMDMNTGSDDPAVAQYRADAQAARYSKVVAEQMYGKRPAFGYRYGGSGGSVRTIQAMENVKDVWDGSVPHIMPNITTGTFGFSISALATRVLRPKLAAIVDALEPGGSGNPFASLDSEQRQVLTELYRAGFPRGAEFSLNDPFEQLLVWAWNGPGLVAADPDYFARDFWSTPGYAGCDEGARLERSVFDMTAKVKHVERTSQMIKPTSESGGTTGDVQAAGGGNAIPRGIVLEGISDVAHAPGARIEILSGKAAGRVLMCLSAGNGVLYGMALGPAGNLLFGGVEPGDEVRVNNRDFIAFNYLHRYLPFANQAEAEQFTVDGKPIHPQRTASAPHLPGSGFSGNFHGRMIIVQNLLDRGTWPMGPVHYKNQARAHFGDGVAQRLRIYYNENAAHLPGSAQPKGAPPVITTRLIDFPGIVGQAVRDLIDWVEFGKEPPQNSNYHVSPDLAVTVPAAASQRGGIQPVVSATANGKTRAEIRAGDEVIFEFDAETPPGTGTIIAAAWDFDGTGSFPFAHDEIDGSAAKVSLQTSHRYDRPGTYFATVRVTSHREGDVEAHLRRCDNLARVRVVVS